MKSFVNDPKNYVPDMLKGIALANQDKLKYIPDYNLIMRADIPQPNKVSIMTRFWLLATNLPTS